MYHGQIEQVAEGIQRWLEKAALKDRTETLIMAAKGRALGTSRGGHQTQVQAVQRFS